MDLKIFPNKSSLQAFYVHGFVVLSHSDQILDADKNISLAQFSEPFVFTSVQRAQSFIDENNLQGFYVWKMFDAYGCRGYSNLENEDESLKDFIEKEHENIKMFSELDDF